MAVAVWADLDGSYLLPLDHTAIRYAQAPVHDRAAQLQERLDRGSTKLAWNAEWGYMPAVLKELGVDQSSQVLVFSKTSFQAPRISPRTPRALYFNDDVTVGWVKGGDVVEIATVDPEQGAVFYTLEQDPGVKPKLQRQDQCLQCHASGGTLGVPGLVIRSVYPDRTGMPLFQAGSYITDDRSPMQERWGGWYVTGTHGGQRHMGNVVAENRENPRADDMGRGANTTSLEGRFDVGAYMTPHSDIVALMALEHQTRMVNILTRVGFETRMAMSDQAAMNAALREPANTVSESTQRRIGRLADEVIRYMLFLDEAPLTDRVKGTSGYTEWYQGIGPKDRRGRSLRELELQHRLLKYRCSPLIYSEQFEALPEPVLREVYKRLWVALTASQGVAAKTPANERAAVLEILTDTMKHLPEWWKRGTGPV